MSYEYFAASLPALRFGAPPPMEPAALLESARTNLAPASLSPTLTYPFSVRFLSICESMTLMPCLLGQLGPENLEALYLGSDR